MRLGYCIPCQHGHHDAHIEVIQAVSEGVMGGAKCRCKGECRTKERRGDHRLLLDRLGLRAFKRHEARHPTRSIKYH